MNIGELIQNIATGGAVLLGATYIIGGLIVNLNLARRGIIEYQIVKVKYLAAGMIFLLQSAGVFTLSFVFAIPVAMLPYQIGWLEGLNVFSMLAAISLILAWARLQSDSRSIWSTWRYWILASTLGALFPMSVLIRHWLNWPGDVLWGVILVQAVFTGILTLMAQIYHYSAFYYGQPSEFVGMLDPIGAGVPVRMRIALCPEDVPLLKSLGVLINKENVTQDLFLVDETDNSYIVGFESLPGQKGNSGTLRIDKSLVKAVLFPPEKGK